MKVRECDDLVRAYGKELFGPILDFEIPANADSRQLRQRHAFQKLVLGSETEVSWNRYVLLETKDQVANPLVERGLGARDPYTAEGYIRLNDAAMFIWLVTDDRLHMEKKGERVICRPIRDMFVGIENASTFKDKQQGHLQSMGPSGKLTFAAGSLLTV